MAGFTNCQMTTFRRKIHLKRCIKKGPSMRGLNYLERVMRIELTTLTLAT